MAQLRVVFLWHMHQPFYKDLVSGEYRLPWVRMHALKDYYGMVKLLEEFPDVHQTFNIVPSLVTQIEDYVAGTARDPFLDIAAKPANELSVEDRHFALQYLFQANPDHLIRRYSRYAELWEQANSREKADAAEKRFTQQDFTDLQVLSQISWFDEFFLGEPEVAGLVQKVRDYSLDDQRQVIELERQLMARVLPEYAAAAKRGSVEISTSPFYHPILPLLCDSNLGRVSSHGIALPQQRFRHPEDARHQIERGLQLHERVFGLRPQGCWPSEGSVSEEVFEIAHATGLRWMATDEGVLGRSQGRYFERDGDGRLMGDGPERLYRPYRYQGGGNHINVLFRDHSLSDLIGFVYSGMDPQQAAAHFIHRLRESAQPLIDKGEDATISVILDGENAWEHYPLSGREFLRRVYAGLADAGIEAVTASEAIEREKNPGALESLVPGSWIDANFNVWIGAPEDNRSWDYLSAARDFYQANSATAEARGRDLAYEELLIAEGSDWNWWYGPEHHSANDRDFDELYRKHLSNVYRALGAVPPDYLAQPIIREAEFKALAVPQTSYIHPSIDGNNVRYFDWMGAATLSADSRDSAMHGKEFVLKALYAGIDESKLYGRVDFQNLGMEEHELVVHVESHPPGEHSSACTLRLDVAIVSKKIVGSKVSAGENGQLPADPENPMLAPEMRLRQIFEFSVPLARLQAEMGSRLRLRVTLWRNGLPLDSVPSDGWMEIPVIAEDEMKGLAMV